MNNHKPIATAAGLANLQRPRFSPGMLLEDEDMNAGVSYTRDLTRLLFRSLFGCGVICGLRVTAEPICNRSKLKVVVERGLALDCVGNPIEIPSAQTIEYNPDCDAFPESIWVVVCYVDRCCRPKDVSCGSEDDGQSKPTRLRSAFEIKLYDSAPECACQCPDDTGGTQTTTGDQDCCDDQGNTPVQPTAVAITRPAADDADKCPCYDEHFHGDCECDCGCNCVLIGRIAVRALLDSADPHAPQRKADTSSVRRIRPVLTGYYDRCWPKPTRTPAPQPPPPQPPAPLTPDIR